MSDHTRERWRSTGLDSPALASAPVAIYAVDLDGNVCFWNRRAADLFGWSEHDVMGRPPPFVGPDEHHSALAAFAQLLEGTPYVTGEFNPVHRDGHRFRTVVTSSVMRDPEGTAIAVLTLARDVTADIETVRLLEAAEHKWRQLALRASDTITIADAAGHVLESTGEMKPTMGYPSGWWKGKSGFELIHPDDLDDAAELWAQLVTDVGGHVRSVFRTRHHDGHYDLVEFTGVNMLDDPVVKGIVVANRNVSTEKQAELLLSDEARILELVARDAPLPTVLDEIVAMVDYHTTGETGVFLVGAEGSLRASAAGRLPDALIHLVEQTQLARFVDPDQAADAGNVDGDEVTIRFNEPTTIVEFADDDRTRSFAQPLLDLGYHACWAVPIHEHRAPRLFGFIGTYLQQARKPTRHERRVHDRAGHLAAIAVERAGWQKELWEQARFDPLTGLPNRAAIFDALEEALTTARLGNLPLTTMLIDLDRFKLINDSLGHAVGDRLIAQFARRLRSALDDEDFLGRVGADEFVVIFPAAVTEQQAYGTAVRIARSLERPFMIDSDEIFLACSIGLATSASGRERADALLQQADMAMFHAKDQGRARTVVFDESLRSRSIDRLQIERDLRLAIERSEFVLHYQPEVDCRTGRVVGTEALLRWEHPTRGLLGPDEFIAAAEETGAIVPIGYWVLDEAVRQARVWTESVRSLDSFMVNVNLSARQLANRGLVDTVAFVLTRYNWAPSQLTLELTESIVIEDQETTLEVLNRLRLLGVRLAIDDFGTGFASLDYLQRLHVDMIKIDRSFVTPLCADGTGSPVAAAMMGMAEAFELTVCAEGVETAEQFAGLRALGCDLAQGYLMARPLPPDGLEAMLRARPTW